MALRIALWKTGALGSPDNTTVRGGGRSGPGLTCKFYFCRVSTKTVTGQTSVVSKVLALYSSDDEGVKSTPAFYQKIVVALQQQGSPVPPGGAIVRTSRIYLDQQSDLTDLTLAGGSDDTIQERLALWPGPL